MKIPALTLSIAALCAATSAAQTSQPFPPSGPPVIVTSGEGVVKRAPDRAWVTIAAEDRARTPQEAQQANVDAMNAVIGRIRQAGIADDAIQTAGYTLQPEFDYQNGRQSLRDYVARNQVRVRVDALAKTGDVIGAAVASGATSISGVQFDLKDRSAAEREAVSLAVRDARQRADAAASGAGVQIERILRIEEQREVGPMPRPMLAVARAGVAPGQADASVPLEGGEIELHAHVTLTVAIR
jgi:uncharacterized protein YggE